MNKLPNYILTLLFGLILCAPVLNDSFHFFKFERKDENRKFHDSLSVSINHLDNFPKDFEDYLSDNFSFRSPLITFSKDLKLNYFHISPDKEQILIGTKNRYFIADDHQKIYEGDIQYGKGWLDTLEGEWIRRKAYFDSLGISVRIVLAPIAHEIYPEELPFNIIKRTGKDPITLSTNRLNKRFPNLVFNPIPLITANKSRQKMYYELDNHWTENGGFLVAQSLLEEIKRTLYPQLDLSPLKQFTWKTEIRNFGHFTNVLATDQLSETILLIDKSPANIEVLENLPLEFERKGVGEHEQQLHYRVKGCKNKLRVLVIRDSFGGALVAPISACFSESVFIFDSWTYRLNKQVIESYKPDLVIYVTYEEKLKAYTDPANWNN